MSDTQDRLAEIRTAAETHGPDAEQVGWLLEHIEELRARQPLDQGVNPRQPVGVLQRLVDECHEYHDDLVATIEREQDLRLAAVELRVERDELRAEIERRNTPWQHSDLWGRMSAADPEIREALIQAWNERDRLGVQRQAVLALCGKAATRQRERGGLELLVHVDAVRRALGDS